MMVRAYTKAWTRLCLCLRIHKPTNMQTDKLKPQPKPKHNLYGEDYIFNCTRRPAG